MQPEPQSISAENTAKREQRVAEALRENLRRRKRQAEARKISVQSDEDKPCP